MRILPWLSVTFVLASAASMRGYKKPSQPVLPAVDITKFECMYNDVRAVDGNSDVFEMCDHGAWVPMMCAPGTWFDADSLLCHKGDTGDVNKGDPENGKGGDSEGGYDTDIGDEENGGYSNGGYSTYDVKGRNGENRDGDGGSYGNDNGGATVTEYGDGGNGGYDPFVPFSQNNEGYSSNDNIGNGGYDNDDIIDFGYGMSDINRGSADSGYNENDNDAGYRSRQTTYDLKYEKDGNGGPYANDLPVYESKKNTYFANGNYGNDGSDGYDQDVDDDVNGGYDGKGQNDGNGGYGGYNGNRGNNVDDGDSVSEQKVYTDNANSYDSKPKGYDSGEDINGGYRYGGYGKGENGDKGGNEGYEETSYGNGGNDADEGLRKTGYGNGGDNGENGENDSTGYENSGENRNDREGQNGYGNRSNNRGNDANGDRDGYQERDGNIGNGGTNSKQLCMLGSTQAVEFPPFNYEECVYLEDGSTDWVIRACASGTSYNTVVGTCGNFEHNQARPIIPIYPGVEEDKDGYGGGENY